MLGIQRGFAKEKLMRKEEILVEHGIWQSVKISFTVSDIMTKRDQWEVIMIEDRNETCKQELKYDVTPISRNGIVNTFIQNKNNRKEQEITRDWLITNNTSIPELIKTFIETKKPALFVIKTQDFVGLVTPADINKLEARSFMYYVIGELELVIVEFIRIIGQLTPDEIINCFSEKRRADILETAEKLHEENVDVTPDYLELLQFSELIRIIEKNEKIYNALGFMSRAKAHDSLYGLVNLRNAVMHPSKPLIIDKYTSLKDVNDRFLLIEYLFNKINELCKEQNKIDLLEWNK